MLPYFSQTLHLILHKNTFGSTVRSSHLSAPQCRLSHTTCTFLMAMDATDVTGGDQLHLVIYKSLFRRRCCDQNHTCQTVPVLSVLHNSGYAFYPTDAFHFPTWICIPPYSEIPGRSEAHHELPATGSSDFPPPVKKPGR